MHHLLIFVGVLWVIAMGLQWWIEETPDRAAERVIELFWERCIPSVLDQAALDVEGLIIWDKERAELRWRRSDSKVWGYRGSNVSIADFTPLNPPFPACGVRWIASFSE